MNPRYNIKQKVVIKPPAAQSPDPRNSTLDKYAGQIGTIVDCYWISTHLSGVFYIYRVKVGANDSEIVVHEDEIEELTGVSLKSRK